MSYRPVGRSATACLLALVLLASGRAHAASEVDTLLASMLGDTPVLDDLRELTDTIGGRLTGSDANRAAVEWAMQTLRRAGVPATSEPFEMPMQWQEIRAEARVLGDVGFEPQVVAKPFSTGTPAAFSKRGSPTAAPARRRTSPAWAGRRPG